MLGSVLERFSFFCFNLTSSLSYDRFVSFLFVALHFLISSSFLFFALIFPY
jgi:hypothetical protein